MKKRMCFKMDRIGIIKKYTKKENLNKKPTKEELEEAYGYLDYCYECGKKFSFWDRLFNYSHNMLGSCHKRCKVVK